MDFRLPLNKKNSGRKLLISLRMKSTMGCGNPHVMRGYRDRIHRLQNVWLKRDGSVYPGLRSLAAEAAVPSTG
jgi:hypothetical protein